MKSITVTADRTYSVIIGCNWKNELLLLTGTAHRALVIHSKNQPQPHVDLGETEVFFLAIADGEEGKTLSTLDQILNTLGAAAFTRNDLIIAVGGGAVTDVSGFAASIWLRGIDWIAIPTTVAGMVDAAVGGKTGINTSYGKNLVGSFYSPIAVLEDFSWLETLSNRDFSAGLAEVVKCGFIADSAILDLLEGSSVEGVRSKAALLSELVERSVAVKATIVSADFKESFMREILNYGHTFGHAIEKHSKYSLRHGEAVALGMIFVAELAFSRGLLSRDDLAQHYDVIGGLGLPVKLPDGYTINDWDALFAIMALDKKNRGSVVRLVIVTEPGAVERVENASKDELFAAYEKVLP